MAEQHHVLSQNLLASDSVRRLAWAPPVPITPDTVAAQLRALGARPWQLELTGDELAGALIAAATSIAASTSSGIDPPDIDPPDTAPIDQPSPDDGS